MATLQSPVLNMSTNVKNLVGLVEKITTSSKRQNGREKILSHVNSRPCHLYNTKIRQELHVNAIVM